MRLRAAGLALLLAGCAGGAGGPADPGIPALPPGAYGSGTGGPAAVAADAFGDAGRTYGRPELAARAMAALEYLAGAAGRAPGLQDVSVDTQAELVVAQGAARGVLHVRPGATGQDVVNALLAAARLLDAGDIGATAAALDRSGVFTVPGGAVVDVLSRLPYLRGVNLATQHVADELAHNDTEYRHF